MIRVERSQSERSTRATRWFPLTPAGTRCPLLSSSSKSIAVVKPSSVVRKPKDKAFARSVSRQDIYDGAKELGVDLEEHAAFVREALLPIAEEIGVAGRD